MKCAEFIGMMFLARDVTHSVHLNTRSYAKHKALQKFYENIIDPHRDGGDDDLHPPGAGVPAGRDQALQGDVGEVRAGQGQAGVARHAYRAFSMA